jgi:hypothetical protein
MIKYDVFISFHNVSPDNAMAKELYTLLEANGVRAFYSPVSVTARASSNYRDVVDEALDTCRIMVAVGTTADNFTHKWVKHEYSTFHSDILSGNPKKAENELISLIPPEMSHYDLPITLRTLQFYNSAQEVLDFVRNNLGLADKPEQAVVETPRVADANPEPAPETVPQNTVGELDVNGGKYIGEIVDGVPTGKGKLSFASGTEYVGDFVDGKLLHLQIEFFMKANGDPDDSIVIDILGGAGKGIYQIYVDSCNPADFPKFGSKGFYDTLTFTADERHRVLSPTFKGFTFYTILVTERVGDKIVASSDFCTFYMNGNNLGIYGNSYKYLPNWPDPSGAIVANGASDGIPAQNGTSEDALAFEASPGFDPYDPDYLVLKNKISTGRFVRCWSIVDDVETNPNMSFSAKYDSIMGIIRTPLGIDEMTALK